MAKRILGIDLSLNHAGFVVMDAAGKIVLMRYVTDIKGAAKGSGATLFEKLDSDDKHQIQVARLAWWEAYLRDLFIAVQPTHVAIEDYAMRAESNAVYQIGEQGGIPRLLAYNSAIPLRLHDPLSLKIFGAENGNATPREVADVVKARFKVDFSFANPPPPKGGKKQNTTPEEDLTSAYVLAKMMWVEIELREGRWKLADLNEKAIQVFNRTTKANPVNLLGREFIRAETA